MGLSVSFFTKSWLSGKMNLNIQIFYGHCELSLSLWSLQSSVRLFHSFSGQCVLSLSSCSAFNPTFDLSVSRTVLEDEGFQVRKHTQI